LATKTTTATTDRIEDNCSEKKINNTEHKMRREGREMVNEKLKLRHKHYYEKKIVLFDHFDFSLLKSKFDTVMYEILNKTEFEQILHDDRNEIYACVKSQKVRRIFLNEFGIYMPTVSSYEECGISENELEHTLWILAPLISRRDLELSEDELKKLLTANDPKYIIIGIIHQICV